MNWVISATFTGLPFSNLRAKKMEFVVIGALNNAGGPHTYFFLDVLYYIGLNPHIYL